jgi:EmrB/QacA subfamily drug resistance transporter
VSGRRRAGVALVVVSVGVFLSALDQTMVVTVLPAILRDLHISFTRLDDAAWIVTGYLLGYTVAMPLFGRIADLRGRRIMFVVSLGIFMLGSALCLFAGSLSALVAARIVQAAGGGAVVPIAMAVAADLFPLERRAFTLGIIGAAAEAGGVLGPLYGAGLSQLWGWRSIFLVNVPLGLILGVLCWLVLPRASEETVFLDESEAGATPSRARPGGRVDYVGAALMAVALSALAIGLGGNTQTGQAAVKVWWLVGSGLAFAVFLLWESRHNHPLVRLELFKRLPFTAANVANLLVGGALIVGMVEIPLWAYSLRGATEVQGGLLLMRLTVMIPIGALLGGWVADRLGYRLTAVAGFAATAAGYALMALWPGQPSELTMTRDLMLTGLGFGLVIAPIGATVIAAVGPRWMATGSALVTVMRMVGMMVGLSALSSWGIRRFNGLMANTMLPLRTEDLTDQAYDTLVRAYDATLTAALRTVYSEFFWIAGALALLAIIPAVFFYRGRRGREFRTPLFPQ